MAVSRRRFLTSVVPGSLLAAAAAAEGIHLSDADHPALKARLAADASPAGDVVGKITVGYQGWFACAGDGAPIDGWWHWSNDWSQPPSPSNNAIKAWPDMSGYAKGYQTAYANLNNGQPATLFSSFDQQTVNTHFQWMQANGCDTAALQRFNPNSSEGPTRNAMATKVRTAAEAYGRKFYIMYDVSGWTNMQTEITADWTAKMSALTASAAYATQNGKPVVGIWGFGFNDDNHPWPADACLDVVNWFKSQGCYVIGGVPTWWRTGRQRLAGRVPGRLPRVQHDLAVDGRPDRHRGRLRQLLHQCERRATRPTATPTASTTSPACCPATCPPGSGPTATSCGGSSTTWSGSARRASTSRCSTSTARATRSPRPRPPRPACRPDSGLLTLDEDGTACSSDYYLRLTADGGKMLKGQIALTATRPTAPVLTTSSSSNLAAAGGRLGERLHPELPAVQCGRREHQHVLGEH